MVGVETWGGCEVDPSTVTCLHCPMLVQATWRALIWWFLPWYRYLTYHRPHVGGCVLIPWLCDGGCRHLTLVSPPTMLLYDYLYIFVVLSRYLHRSPPQSCHSKSYIYIYIYIYMSPAFLNTRWLTPTPRTHKHSERLNYTQVNVFVFFDSEQLWH